MWIMEGRCGDLLVVGEANCTWDEVVTKPGWVWARSIICSTVAQWGDTEAGYLDSTVASQATPGRTLLYFINSPDDDEAPSCEFVMVDDVLCVQLLRDVPVGVLAPAHALAHRMPWPVLHYPPRARLVITGTGLEAEAEYGDGYYWGAAGHDEGDTCPGCGVTDWLPKLECHLCGAGWHQPCLDPPLSVVPDGEWYCRGCWDKWLPWC